MIKKVLIANRGEIAVRIIRACREMGIISVAIYSPIDRDALHVQLADEAICVGGNKLKDSYLNINNIISAADVLNCDAIHPGFGFLSENAKFAQICEECNIKFIGPSGHVISSMGDKSTARKIMKAANVPIVPGSKKILKTVDEARELANEVGYPVLLKATAGGGGRGMRIAESPDSLEHAYLTAKSEAQAAFGNGDMYLEKYILNPRHVEVQIIADQFGNTVHLGERDCSVQRRNQKMIEESPSVVLDDETRKKMGEDAVKAATSVGYENAGTVEFLLDNDNNYYFIEMNTRIQVEHPVTEMVTGIDIIKEQIKVASGKKLSINQSEVSFNGHAIECRINAEDPLNDFRPNPGVVECIHLPGGNGVRFDSSVYHGYKIPPTYDSMLGKLIVHAKTRQEAIELMKRALGEFEIRGIKTNINFQFEIMNNENFINSNYDTSFIEKNMENIIKEIEQV